MAEPSREPTFKKLTQDELEQLTMATVQELFSTYEAGRDRTITPENVFQTAVIPGRDVMEALQDKLMLPGSQVEGLENLDHCLAELEAGKSVLFMPEHRGNFDVPAFNTLLRRQHPRYGDILDRLVYIAGRKLNESSDFIKVFTEKYGRLIIVPRRDYPPQTPHESEAEAREREAYEQNAMRINRAAFREMIRLKRAGRIFVLFPLGGRLKPDADNIPVKESASYISGFDTAYLISMDGNTLPPAPRMEDERPIQGKVVFRVGKPLDCKAYLAQQKSRYEEEKKAGRVPDTLDNEQFTVNRVMKMLENLRLHGDYEDHPSTTQTD